MWTPLADDRFGLMNNFSDSIAAAVRGDARTVPDLTSAETVLALSDYSGQHKSSRFEAFTFLYADGAAWPEWERRRRAVRERHKAADRRMSFKKLGDALKRRMLPDFLQAADVLPGLCVCVLIDKSIPSMFRREGGLDLNEPELAQLSHRPQPTVEKLLRVVHLTSLFLAGLTRPGQDVLWFTDEDDIAANAGGVVELTRVWGNVLSHYLRHSLRHIRCGTTLCDNGSLEIEDLAAIPDLVAGAVTDAVNGYVSDGTFPSGRVLIPAANSTSSKAREIFGWFSEEDWPLRRLVYCFRAVPDSTAINFMRLRFHGGQPPAVGVSR